MLGGRRVEAKWGDDQNNTRKGQSLGMADRFTV